MSIIDDIKNDRESGTPGPWVTPYDDHDCYVDTPGESHYTFIGKNSAPLAAAIVHSAFAEDKRLDANARRIARVPQLENIALAAHEFEQAMLQVLAFRAQCAHGSTNLTSLALAMNRAEVALTDFREACREGAA